MRVVKPGGVMVMVDWNQRDARQRPLNLCEVPTLLLMRLAFGAGLCRFGMFRAVRSEVRSQSPEATPTEAQV